MASGDSCKRATGFELDHVELKLELTKPYSSFSSVAFALLWLPQILNRGPTSETRSLLGGDCFLVCSPADQIIPYQIR